MNIGNYTQKLSEWMIYKKYSKESIKNYVSCLGKFLKHFEDVATKPSEISAEQIKKFLSNFNNKNPLPVGARFGRVSIRRGIWQALT